ncbi:MAG: mechanosensitive ion channel domain-containing protein [Pseudomonadota bacterium]
MVLRSSSSTDPSQHSSVPVLQRATAVLATLLAALALTLFAGLGSANAQSLDLEQLKERVEALDTASNDLDLAIQSRRRENASIANGLASFGSGGPITLERLRQAQFEANIARSRLSTLALRRNEHEARLESTNAAIVAASANLSRADRSRLSTVVIEAALDWYGQIRTRQASVIQRLLTYEALTADYLSLRREQLAILQGMIELWHLEGIGNGPQMAIIERLRTLVDRLATTGVTLSNEADSLQEEGDAAQQRRNLLRLRADELLLRSTARLADIGIVEARATTAAVRRLVEEPSIPSRLFDNALDELERLSGLLSARIATIASNREAIQSLSMVPGVSTDGGVAGAILQSRVAGLEVLLAVQEREITALQEEIASTSAALADERAVRLTTTLTRRETARLDRATRRRIATELWELPSELRSVFERRMTEVGTAATVAGPQTIAYFAAAVLLLLAVTIYLRQILLKRFVAAQATRATEIPVEVLRRNLFWLMPVGIVWLFTLFVDVPQDTGVAFMTLFVVPAAGAFLRDLTQVIVSRRAHGTTNRMARITTHATEFALVLVAGVALVYLLLGEVPLLPSTEAAINRLAYSVFVLGGLPMLLFIFVFADSDGGRRSAFRRAVAALLSLVPPLALIATGVVGLAGYTQLAALLLEDLGIAIGLAAALALALGILHDVVEGVAERMRNKDPARAYFLRQNVMKPLYHIGQVILVIVALVVAAEIFDWSRQTPGIRQALGLWNTTLFSVGSANYSIGSVVLAAAALVFVFWIAAWSRRIAYSVVLRRLKDIGIRQSLSVFAQYVVIVVGVLLTLSIIGFDVTTLTVFAASLGVGIGFGLQNVVNNFISGLLLLVERPLRLGDIVTVAGSSGTVEQIGIRSMRMRTFDEYDLIVPNSALVSDTFTNWTRSNSVIRVLKTIGISYDDDPDEAIAIILDILNAHPGIVRNPAPMVTADEFADSSINLRVCWYFDLRGSMSGFVIRSQVLASVWHAFRQAGISIPFPQRDIHMVPVKTDEVFAGPPQPRKTPTITQGEGAADHSGDAIEMAEAGKDG